MNNSFDRLIGNNLSVRSRDGVIAKYAYSFSIIDEYVNNGDVSYSANWDGHIESYSYNSYAIDDLKEDLDFLEVTFR